MLLKGTINVVDRDVCGCWAAASVKDCVQEGGEDRLSPSSTSVVGRFENS